MVPAPTSFLPRDAGEDEELAPDLIRGGGLNGLNVLNEYCRLQVCSLKGT
jgi:hypothetical protein